MRHYFSAEEMREITHLFEEVLAEDRQGQRFNGEKRQAVLGFVEKRPRLIELVEDNRIFEPLEQLLGPEFTWIGSDGNLYVGDTHWHPDGSNLHYLRIKVAFYLDQVTRETGCLRVIPGSHLPPLHDQLKPLMERRNHQTPEQGNKTTTPFSVGERDIPAFPLESEPGDVVFFNQNLWHASFGGRTGRRMFTINFGQKPTQDEHFDYLKRVYQSNLKHIEMMQYTQRSQVYEDAFLHSDRPRIQGMVGTLLALGFV
jgi:hypothetical protein